jgi:hypothetical protein
MSFPNTEDDMEIRERTLGEVLREAAGNVSELFHAELRLVRAEVHERTVKVKPLIAQGVIGLILLSYSLLFLLLCAMWFISLYIPMWQAALLVGASAGIIAIPMLLSVRTRFKRI